MIVTPTNSWLRSVFALRGTALERVWARLLVTGGFALLLTVLDHYYVVVHLTPTPWALIGLALSIFLGFRNNTSYDRYWEGRKLWGGLVNCSRTMTRQITTLIRPEDRARTRELVYRMIAYVHCLRLHLRDDPDHSELSELLPEEEMKALDNEWNRPAYLVQRMGDRYRDLYDEELIDPMHLPQLDNTLTDIMNVQGGCERIKSTPIPYTYNVLIHRIVAFYCFTLSFGLVQTIGIYTPVVVLLIAYAFFGLDAVGEQIEDPFGLDPNDLALDGLCNTIERNLRQRVDETELPSIPTGDLRT